MGDVLPLLSRHGACAGMSVGEFYPEGRGTAPSPAAADACARCRVGDICLEWALERGEWGYWAGTTERDRAALRKRRNRAAQRERERAAV